jgi:hypothetical protein
MAGRLVATTTSESKLRGIEEHRGKFRARIFRNGRRITLGYFATIAAAAEAYDAAARAAGATFVNFPKRGERKFLAVPARPPGTCAHGHDLAQHGYRYGKRINCRICNAAAQARRKKRLRNQMRPR